MNCIHWTTPRVVNGEDCFLFINIPKPSVASRDCWLLIDQAKLIMEDTADLLQKLICVWATELLEDGSLQVQGHIVPLNP